jgi:hypothetical protein
VKTFELEEIPPLRGDRPAGAVAVSRKAPRQSVSLAGPTGLSRRSILRAAIASGTALGFAALGVFPAARRAYAEGYDIWTGACPSYADNHNCSPGCGPSPVRSNACSGGWHRTGGTWPEFWSLRIDACTTQWREADGWLWSYTGYCNGCRVITWRCHDGWYTYCDYYGCYDYDSICRYRYRCYY